MTLYHPPSPPAPTSAHPTHGSPELCCPPLPEPRPQLVVRSGDRQRRGGGAFPLPLNHREICRWMCRLVELRTQWLVIGRLLAAFFCFFSPSLLQKGGIRRHCNSSLYCKGDFDCDTGENDGVFRKWKIKAEKRKK